MQEFDLIEFVVASGTATVTLNRPDKRNAISDSMRLELIRVFEHIAEDKKIKALVLTGKGKGFCAGGDIAGMQKRLNSPSGEVALLSPFFTLCPSRSLPLSMGRHRD